MDKGKLCDSNIFIYAASGNYPDLFDFIERETPAVALVTQIEVLGYHKLQQPVRLVLEDLFRIAPVLALDDVIAIHAITLRQRRKMSLGDAIIAATALEHDLTLVTRNLKDFRWIAGLRLIDPLAPTG